MDLPKKQLSLVFILILMITSLASFGDVESQKKLEAQCKLDGQIWKKKSCIELPLALLDTWYYYGSAFNEGGKTDKYVHNLELNAPKISFKFEDELMLLNTNMAQKVTAVVVTSDSNKGGVSQFALASGFVSFATYIPSSLTETNQLLEPLRRTGRLWVDRDWLVIEHKRVGKIYFSKIKEASAGLDYYERHEKNACLTMWSQKNETFDKLLEHCLSIPSEKNYRNVGAVSLAHVIVRNQFSRLTDKANFRECLRDNDCDFEANLAKALSMSLVQMPFFMNSKVVDDITHIIQNYAKLREEFQKARHVIDNNVSRTRREFEFIVDSLSIDGTESLLSPVDDSLQRERNLELAKSLTLNVGCTGIGFVPVLGDAIALLCGGASVVESSVGYAQGKDETLGVSRTPTVLNLKHYYQGLNENSRDIFLSIIDQLKELSYNDVTLAAAMVKYGVANKFIQPEAEYDARRRAFWVETLSVLGFLSEYNSVPTIANLKNPKKSACSKQLFERHPAVSEASFLILNEGAWVTKSKNQTWPFKASQLNWPENQDRTKALYNKQFFRTISWHLHVGRPLESRPMRAEAFNDLRRLFTMKEVYDLVKDRTYLTTKQIVTPDFTSHCRMCPAVSVTDTENVATIKRTKEMKNWNYPLERGAYYAMPINPTLKSNKYGIGPEVSGTRCYY